MKKEYVRPEIEVINLAPKEQIMISDNGGDPIIGELYGDGYIDVSKPDDYW